MNLTRFVRRLFVSSVGLVSPEHRVRSERWLRGRRDYRRLRRADLAVVSYGKSGRTWLRVMMSRYYQVEHGVSDSSMLTFSNYHRQRSAVPRVLFTHDNYLEDYVGTTEKVHFHDKRVVLLVRDPLDVAVSQYFQWLHRMKPSKMELNGYPPHGSEVALYDFVMDPDCGLPKIIDYLNRWANELPRIESPLVVRYEDLRREPVQGLSRIMEFAESGSVSDEAVREAVRYASVDNMRALERGDAYAKSGTRLTPGDARKPDSFKVRRAKVGGYRDYFEPDELKTIEGMVGSRLAAVYGYDADSAGDVAPRSVGESPSGSRPRAY